MKLTREEQALILKLRDENPASHIPSYDDAETTLGQKMADKITQLVGSWKFLIIQTIILSIWMTLNVVAYVQHWDPYPFILLNLVLSFQAAYAAPIIMMSQNRQSEIDREKLEYYYDVNIKEELEIELLHEKVDALMVKFDVQQPSSQQ